MPRPALNAAPAANPSEALSKLPKAPRYMDADQRAAYRRIGSALVEAGTVTAADMLMIEAAARVLARLTKMYGDATASAATIAALERLHKEQLVQLGLTPAARKNAPKLSPSNDAEGDELKDLLEG